MANGQVEFRIYVADLHEYNAGRLVGSWLTPSEYSSDEELGAAITQCMSADDHEHAFHDSEGVSVGEHETTTNVMHITRAVLEHGAEKVDLFIGQGRSHDLASLSDDITEADRGEFSDSEAWAFDYIQSCHDLDKMLGQLACYFDYAAFARDAEMNGEVTFLELSNGNTWVLCA